MGLFIIFLHPPLQMPDFPEQVLLHLLLNIFTIMLLLLHLKGLRGGNGIGGGSDQ